MTHEHTIFDQDKAPECLIERYIWWALMESPSQKYKKMECGHNAPIYTRKECVHPDAIERIINECNDFWSDVKDALKSSYGKCNWHKSVDSEEHHAASGGTMFYFARQKNLFSLENVPEEEKCIIINTSEKFIPMFLGRKKDDHDGLFQFVEDPEKFWAAHRQKEQEEGVSKLEKYLTPRRAKPVSK